MQQLDCITKAIISQGKLREPLPSNNQLFADKFFKFFSFYQLFGANIENKWTIRFPEAFFRFCLYRYCYTQPLLLSLRSSSDELVFFHIPYKLSFPRDRSRSLKYEMFPHQPISCAILSAAYLQAAAMRHFGCRAGSACWRHGLLSAAPV